jgi:16S rRNA U516 pseudouridylate synthase RsuA-like enzyme
MLLTNDGELAEKLTHPSGGIKKIYQAELDKPITTEDFRIVTTGLELEDGFIRPDEVGIVTPDAHGSRFGNSQRTQPDCTPHVRTHGLRSSETGPYRFCRIK